jgi:hypothetical protein
MNIQSAIRDVSVQMKTLLEQLPPAAYCQPLPAYNGSSIGQHFRHIIEFFQCLESGIENAYIDYAARERNTLYECNPTMTAAAMDTFVTGMDNHALDKPLLVCAELGEGSRPAYQSTYGRELLFAFDHAIHHLAIIRIGMHAHFPEISTQPTLGISPSTLLAKQRKEA